MEPILAKNPIEELAQQAEALKQKYAELDPDLVRAAVIELVTGPNVTVTLERLTPLFEVMKEDDPLRTHVHNWIQVVKGVSLLAKQAQVK